MVNYRRMCLVVEYRSLYMKALFVTLLRMKA